MTRTGPAGPSEARRSREAHQAIIGATQQILVERGYAALTIEGVAARAGVGKQTIYRWWPSKPALVLEAYLAATLERVPPPPDTKSVRRDVHVLLSSHVAALADPSAAKVVAGLVAASAADPDLAARFRTEVVAPRRAIMREILERGRQRGQLRRTADLDLAVDLLHGPTFYRLLLSGDPLDADYARDVAAFVLDSLAPDAPSSRERP